MRPGADCIDVRIPSWDQSIDGMHKSHKIYAHEVMI